jgi:hypothetical protein
LDVPKGSLVALSALSLMKKEQQSDASAIADEASSTQRAITDRSEVPKRETTASIRMSPSRVLKLYYLASFLIGLVLTVFLVHWIATKEIGIRGGAIVTLSFNVLMIMLLPLVLDWAEMRYFKARFLGLEEIAKTNPNLATSLEEQCKRLDIPKLRLAIVESPSDELFSYGLWRINPRLVLSKSILSGEDHIRMLPSVEAELARFASQDRPLVFLMFTVVQEICQIILLTSHLIR